MKILIIEDESELLQVIKTSLEKEQYVVETASSLNTAFEKIGIYDYDCILLDITLPDGNGFEILCTFLSMLTTNSYGADH